MRLPITAAAAAELLGLSRRRMNELLAAGRIEGAWRVGHGRRCVWLVPVQADGTVKVTPRVRGPTPKYLR